MFNRNPFPNKHVILPRFTCTITKRVSKYLSNKQHCQISPSQCVCCYGISLKITVICKCSWIKGCFIMGLALWSYLIQFVWLDGCSHIINKCIFIYEQKNQNLSESYFNYFYKMCKQHNSINNLTKCNQVIFINCTKTVP